MRAVADSAFACGARSSHPIDAPIVPIDVPIDAPIDAEFATCFFVRRTSSGRASESPQAWPGDAQSERRAASLGALKIGARHGSA